MTVLCVLVTLLSNFALAASGEISEIPRILGYYANRSTHERVEYRCENAKCSQFDIVLIDAAGTEQVIAPQVSLRRMRAQFELAERYNEERFAPSRVVPYLSNRIASDRNWWEELGPTIFLLVPVFAVTGAVDLVTSVPVQLVKYLGLKERDKRQVRRKIYYPEGRDQALSDRVFKKVVEGLRFFGDQISTLASIERHNGSKKQFQDVVRSESEALNTLANSKVSLKIQDLGFANQLLDHGTNQFISFDTFDYYYGQFNTRLAYGSWMKQSTADGSTLYAVNDSRAVIYSHQNTYCAFESLMERGQPIVFSEGQVFDLQSSVFDETMPEFLVDYSDPFYPKTSFQERTRLQVSRAVFRLTERTTGAELRLQCLTSVNTGALPEAPVSRVMLALYGIAKLEIDRR